MRKPAISGLKGLILYKWQPIATITNWLAKNGKICLEGYYTVNNNTAVKYFYDAKRNLSEIVDILVSDRKGLIRPIRSKFTKIDMVLGCDNITRYYAEANYD